MSDIEIKSLREYPEMLEEFIGFFAGCWSNEAVYRDCLTACLTTEAPLPHWYLLLVNGEIAGGYGLIVNDFNARQDLWPWLCALYVKTEYRGHALGALLLEHGRKVAGKLGFAKLYLATDHIGYYEKYDFQFLGMVQDPFGGTSRMYCIDTLSLKPKPATTAMDLKIRPMIQADICAFPAAFAQQNWCKEQAQFEQYFAKQQLGLRQIFVAEVAGVVAGYATLLPEALSGPFAGCNIPEVVDFNVLIKFQKRGIGSAIMEAIENQVRQTSSKISLGVGLHSGYGTAQRLYVKRGYIPDGSGVWYNNRIHDQYADCCNDDDLVLYLSKDL